MRRYKIIETLSLILCIDPNIQEKILVVDYIIWMDTIKESRFEDTNKMFEQLKNFDFKVTTQR